MSTSRRSLKRYALVGTGARSFMFSEALLSTYRTTSKLVAICDTCIQRMEYHNQVYQEKYGVKPVPMYEASRFGEMIKKAKPDVVIVASMDRTHDRYIIQAMEAGCDVITEKPMATDEKKIAAILAAQQATGRDLRVTFNYRYAPSRSKLKELIMEGTIGEVRSVHFEWLLDTYHGADYFRRWHRDKRNSGGLMVHKATHHFDLVGWWLDQQPELVFGLGELSFYGREQGEALGNYRPYLRATGSRAAKKDPFAINLRDGGKLQGLYLEAEAESGYWRDQNAFGDGISIEDTMNLVVRYAGGTQLSYSLHAYSPWEGYRIAFNGTKGRIELDEMESSYIAAGDSHIADGVSKSQRLTVFPHFEKPYHVDVPQGKGGHGGGDLLLLEALFGKGKRKDPLGRAAGAMDGALSVLTGVAANHSFATGRPVTIRELLTS